MWQMQLLFFILGYFLPFYLPNSPKNENFKKRKEKNTWGYHHFTQVHQKAWSYDLLFLRYGAWRTLMLFFILGNFLPFYPPNSPKNENFKKLKKPLEISSFNTKCTKNHDMSWCSWDTACDRCNCYFSFWAIFCPFTPLPAQKIKISKKKWKQTLEIHHLTQVHQKSWSYALLFLRYGMWET